MKKFKDWIYWEGLRWIILFYMIVPPILFIFDLKIINIILLFLLILLYFWLRDYEKKWNNNEDERE